MSCVLLLESSVTPADASRHPGSNQGSRLAPEQWRQGASPSRERLVAGNVSPQPPGLCFPGPAARLGLTRTLGDSCCSQPSWVVLGGFTACRGKTESGWGWCKGHKKKRLFLFQKALLLPLGNAETKKETKPQNQSTRFLLEKLKKKNPNKKSLLRFLWTSAFFSRGCMHRNQLLKQCTVRGSDVFIQVLVIWQ